MKTERFTLAVGAFTDVSQRANRTMGGKVLNLANAAQVIRERGLRVPEDISLITFHDADWTSVTTPPITVIDQPVYALGKSVAELLIRRLQGDTGPAERLILPTTIIERESVAPPPANGKP